jgi:hypothetical protein
MSPDVALSLKYAADYEWETTRGWRRLRSGERYYCVHGCNPMKYPTATFVKTFPPAGYQLRIDAVCDEHAQRAGVPDAVRLTPPRPTR